MQHGEFPTLLGSSLHVKTLGRCSSVSTNVVLRVLMESCNYGTCSFPANIYLQVSTNLYQLTLLDSNAFQLMRGVAVHREFSLKLYLQCRTR